MRTNAMHSRFLQAVTVSAVALLASASYSAPKPKKSPAPAATAAPSESGESARLIAVLKTAPEKAPAADADAGQAAVDAMAKLAELRSKAAVPVLCDIAAGKLPAGVQALLEHDVNRTAPASRDEFRQRSIRIFRFNAVVALGWIGDGRGLEAVRNAFQAEQSVAARLQIALSMAMLGDPSGMDFVVQVVTKGTRKESAAAAAVYRCVTGNDMGITENTPIRLRRGRATACANDWATIRATFQPRPDAIAQRRKEAEKPQKYQPRTTRDYLRLAVNYFDFNDSLGSRSAREYLAQAGGTLNNDLERICGDPKEDLDIRMEAMNWYFHNNRAAALPLLKKLRRDENPEIVDKANSLLETPLDPGSTVYTFPSR